MWFSATPRACWSCTRGGSSRAARRRRCASIRKSARCTLAMLEVRGLEAGYGRARVLFGVALEVARGEVAVLFGRNGAGKSTTLKAIMGLVRPRGGEVRFDGHAIAGREPFEI